MKCEHVLKFSESSRMRGGCKRLVVGAAGRERRKERHYLAFDLHP